MFFHSPSSPRNLHNGGDCSSVLPLPSPGLPAPVNAEAKIRLRSGLLQKRHHLARPMRVYFLLLLPLLSPLCCIPATAAVPHIIQVSDPVRPDETVLMTGDSFGGQGIVELAQIPAEAKGPMGAGNRFSLGFRSPRARYSRGAR